MRKAMNFRNFSVLFFLAAAGAGLSGCSGCGEETAQDASGDGLEQDAARDEGTGFDLPGDISGDPCTTDGDCAPEDFCSVMGVCIPDGSCLVDGDCDEGLVCSEEHLCEDCGRVEFGTTRLAPNVLILLDRSGSMEGTISGQTRWDITKQATQTVTIAFDAEIRFGLATFSACLPGGCSPGTIVVPIADNNAAAINDFLAPLRGQGSSHGTPPDYLCDSGDPETSTGPTLHALVGEPSLQDPARVNAVLLMTDGQESDCGGPVGAEGAGELYGQTVPVLTYAVGFTTDADMGQINAIAAAGGTTQGYQADSPEDLLAAFESIATNVMRCDYLLGETPPDPSKIYVYFNDDPAEIPNDPDNGWTYDASTNTIHFNGTYCDQLLSGGVTDLDVVYGCPGPIIL
jgi:hypothetical protein